MSEKGFLLVIRDGEARLQLLGYSGAEGHERSHALREAMHSSGLEFTEQLEKKQQAEVRGKVSA